MQVLEMGPYEPYIMGMLTNYGGLPLDRLHAMLKLFVVAPKCVRFTVFGCCVLLYSPCSCRWPC